MVSRRSADPPNCGDTRPIGTTRTDPNSKRPGAAANDNRATIRTRRTRIMQNLANPADSGTGHTMVVFRLGVEAGQHQAAFSARLNALLPRALEIAVAEGDERTLAAARLAAATHQAGAR